MRTLIMRLPRTVVLLGVTSLLTDASSEMIFPLLPLFVAQTLGGGAAFVGIIEGAADATASLVKLYAGRVADHTARRKPLVVTGYGLATFVRPLMALAAAPWHALAIRVVDRTGKGIRSAPRDALIADATDASNAGRAFGFHRAMDHAGAVVGPLVATALLAAHLSLRTVFALALVPGLFALASLGAVRETPQAPRATATAKAPLPPALRRYLAILFLFALGNSSDAFLLLRARELGIATSVIPLLWSVLHVSKVTWSFLGGSWADRFSRTTLVIAGWLVFAVTYLALGLASTPWQAWALFVLYGAYYGLCEPAEKALVKDLAPAAARGSAFGAYNFVGGIAALPAGLVMGWIWDRAGSATALGCGAAVALVAAGLLAITRP